MLYFAMTIVSILFSLDVRIHGSAKRWIFGSRMLVWLNGLVA